MTNPILVTGGAGYIGSHVVNALVDKGRPVAVIDNLSSGSLDFLPKGVSFLQSDISDGPAVRDFMNKQRCSSVIHMAGFVSVEESVSNPLAYYQNNTCASRSFIESCVATGVEHFVFSSSAAVYGNPEKMTVSEEMPTAPVSPYGWSKLMTEVMLSDVCQVSPMTAVSLRYFNVAGADRKGRCGMITKNATHLIKVMSEVALEIRPEIVVFGDDYDTPDGTCIRDFIHVSDLADIHIAALGYLSDGGESAILNCGYGEGYSVRQVVDAMEEVLGKSLNVKVGPRRAGDVVGMVADTTKMKKKLSWSPKYDGLLEIVESSLNWEWRLRGMD